MSNCNVFKKATTLPIVISFTHSVSKSRDYYGCPRVVAECQALNFKAAQVGYGYDMIGAIMSDFINENCTQYVIEEAHAVNEQRGGYNPIRYNSKTQQFHVNFCTYEVDCFFNDYLVLECKFTYNDGKLLHVVISSK